ncbi:MAG: YkgJ family cysteine cluster protein [Deltaproteobacteria bacterium]|nr:YkgJ family cysteine cluster protein [Deltaproteobacteria bacterium]
MSQAFRPALRPDLQRKHDDGEPPSLYDPITDRDLALGTISARLADLIDGQRTVPELIALMQAADPAIDAARVERTIRMLLLLLVLDGPGKDILARAAGLQDGTLPLHIEHLPGIRFACQSSGECCQNYAFGPLRRTDVERLNGLDIAGKLPHLGPGPYTEELETKQGKHHYLKTSDECCIFLGTDNRCGLHATFGAESKPDLCRLYPFQVQTTIAGTAYYDHGECASFSRASQDGDTLHQQLSWLRPLMGDDTTLYHPTVTLVPGLQCDYGYVLRLRDALCTLVEQARGDEHQTLAAVARMSQLFIDGLSTCPLEQGEPEATLERVLRQPPASFAPPHPASPAAFAALAASAESQFAMAVPRVQLAKQSVRQVLSQRLARQFCEVIYVVRVLAEARANGEPAPAEYADLLDRPCAPELTAASKRSLRYQLFSPRLLLDERLLPALERVGLCHVVTQVGARLAARTAGAPRVELEHFDLGHMLAMRMLRQHLSLTALSGGDPAVDNPERVFALLAAAAELAT